ncbi:MAG: hypothetical protein Q9217_000537 [Psora testacea]
MGKNKRKHPDIEEILARPWCYYCERDFDDLKILINHQKAKHYKCERCGRRLNTAGGLSVHMTQVHKETLTAIENALPNRAGLDVEIFGMEGVPEDVVQSHNQRVVQQFAQAEAERRAVTGNPAPGVSGTGSAAKKPKFESPADLKKRLAEHKAKKATEEAAGISSGNNTPRMGDSSQSPSTFAGPGSPAYPSQQTTYGAPPHGAPYQSQPQPYGPQQPPPFQQQSPPPFTPQQQAFSPPGMPQYPNNQPFAPPQQFQPPSGQSFPPQYQNGPPQFQNGPAPHFQNGNPQYLNGAPPQFQTGPPKIQNGPPQQYGPVSPPPFQHNQFQPPRHNTPPQYNSMPQRPGSLPPAPGLPQRPAFGAPPVNAQQMQQMHQGQLPSPPNPINQSYTQQGAPAVAQSLKSPALAGPPGILSANASSLDDLVSGAAKDADKAAIAPETKPEPPKTAPALEEKKTKKEKDKSMKLIYSDNEVSPEEKMAKLPRYAFVPSG